MWILLLIPVAWLMSEIYKLDRPVRLVLGILSITSVAWLFFDVANNAADMRQRFQIHRDRAHFVTHQAAMKGIEEAIRAGDTNRVLDALTAYNATAATADTKRATVELLERLKNKGP